MAAILTATEHKEIAEHLGKYGQGRAACVEALRAVQRRRGWIADDVLGEVAALLGMTAAELDSVATSYNLIYRRRVGRHVILLCDSVSCWIMGYDNVREHLKRRLGIDPGQTSPDDRFTLLPVACLGACDLAPAMMVDDDLHGNLTPEKIDQALERYA